MHKGLIKTTIISSFLSIVSMSSGTTIVYNLRIAEITKRQTTPNSQPHPFIVGVSFFDTYRKTYNDIFQNFIGGFGTFIYSNGPICLRADGAFAHAHQSFETLSSSATQLDDILLSLSYCNNVNENIKLTFSGILGIPTHKEEGFLHVQFGTAHVGLGFQVDNSWTYSKNKKHLFYGAARLVHFFPRSTEIPILTHLKSFDFNVGNLADILVAHHSRWSIKHQLEVGYNLTTLFNASLHPVIPNVTNQINFIRNSFYASYLYGFKCLDKPSAFILAVSYGFDHKPKIFGLKYSVTAFLSWGINF